MKRIDLTPYDIGGDEPFDVKGSLLNVLFFQVGDPRDLLSRGELAKKIESSGKDVLLEDAEWGKFVDGITRSMQAHAIETSRIQVEFVRRILDAPDVDVSDLKVVNKK